MLCVLLTVDFHLSGKTSGNICKLLRCLLMSHGQGRLLQWPYLHFQPTTTCLHTVAVHESFATSYKIPWQLFKMLSCMYIAHHELESFLTIFVITVIISIIVTIMCRCSLSWMAHLLALSLEH